MITFGGSGAGSDGNRYDGAASAEEYAADPVVFSGSIVNGKDSTIIN